MDRILTILRPVHYKHLAWDQFSLGARHANYVLQVTRIQFIREGEFKVTVFMKCTLTDGQYSPLQEVLTRGDMVQKKLLVSF